MNIDMPGLGIGFNHPAKLESRRQKWARLAEQTDLGDHWESTMEVDVLLWMSNSRASFQMNRIIVLLSKPLGSEFSDNLNLKTSGMIGSYLRCQLSLTSEISGV